ncbi:unnamed protein product, partial [Scytosiphon promiscuus]
RLGRLHGSAHACGKARAGRGGCARPQVESPSQVGGCKGVFTYPAGRRAVHLRGHGRRLRRCAQHLACSPFQTLERDRFSADFDFVSACSI